MDTTLLQELARHQAWADAQHWKVLHANGALLEDPQIRRRLNHMTLACEMLQALARGEAPDPASMKDRESVQELEAAMAQANEGLARALEVTVPELLSGSERSRQEEVRELMQDQFIAELLPFVSELNGMQMSSVLAQVRDLTMRPRRTP